MRLAQVLQEQVKIDNKRGIGSVPFNQEIDYMGLRVKMRPQIFLDLAAYFTQNPEKIKKMEELVSSEAIGAPFLQILIPPEWDDNDFQLPAKIKGHEGRHRMVAVRNVYGNDPIEVHLFFRGGLRNRDITEEMIKQLQNQLNSEDGGMVTQSKVGGPIFTL